VTRKKKKNEMNVRRMRRREGRRWVPQQAYCEGPACEMKAVVTGRNGSSARGNEKHIQYFGGKSS
jgi:hypothetical protein